MLRHYFFTLNSCCLDLNFNAKDVYDNDKMQDTFAKGRKIIEKIVSVITEFMLFVLIYFSLSP